LIGQVKTTNLDFDMAGTLTDALLERADRAIAESHRLTAISQDLRSQVIRQSRLRSIFKVDPQRSGSFQQAGSIPP
jgi:hypothetical protein